MRTISNQIEAGETAKTPAEAGSGARAAGAGATHSSDAGAPRDEGGKARIFDPGFRHPQAGRFGRVEWAILLLGLALRAALLVTGRSPMDGDEAMMGMMAEHLRTGQEIPLFFYGQHYMGMIELPLLALLQTVAGVIGGESWVFSVWVIRLTEAVYFGLLAWAHVLLVGRFFGRRVARWSLFFICVGPFFWMDYSQRLRHVVLMMAAGEALALMTLRVMEMWADGRRVKVGLMAAIGLLAGLEWYHYQLIVIFYLTIFATVLLFSRFVWDLLRKPPVGSSEGPDRNDHRERIDGFAVAQTLAAGALVAAVMLITLGYGARLWPYYAWIFAGIGAAAACLLWWTARRYRRERVAWIESADPRVPPGRLKIKLVPAVFAVAFFIGFFPGVIYLVTLAEEFWIIEADFVPGAILSNLFSVFMLEVATLLELTRAVSPSDPYEQTITIGGIVQFTLYALGLYLLAGKLWRPEARSERIGATFFLLLAAILLGFRAAFWRHTPFNEPRFIVPLIATTSVMLALLAEGVIDAVRQSVEKNRERRKTIGVAEKGEREALRTEREEKLTAGAVVAVGAGFLLLWAFGWRQAPAWEMDVASGHRRITVDLVEALEERGVERIYVEYAPGAGPTGWAPFGWEIMYASGMDVRPHWGTFDDRLWGHVDERRWALEEFYVFERDLSQRFSFVPQGEELDVEGFEVGRYKVIPLPESYRPKGGWRGDHRGARPPGPWVEEREVGDV